MNYFYQRPSEAMNSKVPKFLTSGDLAFEVKKVSDQQKALFREKFLKKVAPFAMWDQRNRPESFFEGGFQIEKNLLRLPFDNDLMEVPVKPWSGDYWATFKGGVASRYNDPDYPQSWDFMENYKAYQEYSKIDFSDPVKISNLSPSEKYDILVGDENFSLTRWSFESAHQTYLENNNEIEPWFGICHGWAPASYIEPRPNTSVDVSVVGLNSKVRFLPSDLKALASQMWAKSRFSTRFIGGRCEERDVKTDEATGKKMTATSKSANYSALAKSITFKGNASITRGTDRINGTIFTYDIVSGLIKAQKVDGVFEQNE
jgi:hypothetical protein